MKARLPFSTIVALISLVAYGQGRPKISRMFSVSPTSAQFNHEGDSKGFIVKSNSPWIISTNAKDKTLINIFKKHGYIWGRWYHYGTIHFEYRLEILSGCIVKQQ